MKKIISIIILIIILDFVIGSSLKYLYNNTGGGIIYSLNRAFYNADEKIIILGNSRALHHFNPAIITKNTNRTCFNYGVDGGHSILLHYSELFMITQRYSPDLIILEFSPVDFFKYSIDYENLKVMLPYFKLNPEVDKIILMKSPNEKIKFLSKIYPYNSCIYDYFAQHFKKVNNTILLSGFDPLDAFIDTNNTANTITTNDNHPEIDSNKLVAFQKFVKICTEKKIHLLIINSPLFKYEKDINYTVGKNILMENIKNGDIKFIDYSNDNNFSDYPGNFADLTHLNSKGANYYSEMISSVISEFLEERK